MVAEYWVIAGHFRKLVDQWRRPLQQQGSPGAQVRAVFFHRSGVRPAGIRARERRFLDVLLRPFAPAPVHRAAASDHAQDLVRRYRRCSRNSARPPGRETLWRAGIGIPAVAMDNIAIRPERYDQGLALLPNRALRSRGRSVRE